MIFNVLILNGVMTIGEHDEWTFMLIQFDKIYYKQKESWKDPPSSMWRVPMSAEILYGTSKD